MVTRCCRSLLLVLLGILCLPGVGFGQWGPSSGDCPDGRCPTPPRSGAVRQPSAAVHDPSDWPAVCVVRVLAGGSQGRQVYHRGTGVLVYVGTDHGVVLTAAHVLRGRATDECDVVFQASGGRYTAYVYESDSDNDVAAIVIDGAPTERPATVADKVPGNGEKLTLIGCGAPSEGFRAIGTRMIGPGTNFIWARGGSRQGDSGGPVLDGRGRVCAIISATDGTRTVCMTGRMGGGCGILRGLVSRFRARWQQRPGWLFPHRRGAPESPERAEGGGRDQGDVPVPLEDPPTGQGEAPELGPDQPQAPAPVPEAPEPKPPAPKQEPAGPPDGTTPEADPEPEPEPEPEPKPAPEEAPGSTERPADAPPTTTPSEPEPPSERDPINDNKVSDSREEAQSVLTDAGRAALGLDPLTLLLSGAAAATGVGLPAVAIWGAVVGIRALARRRRRRQKEAPRPVAPEPTPPQASPATPIPDDRTSSRRESSGGGSFTGFLGARDTHEAEEFLRLSQLEGRNPVLDALAGRIAMDRLDQAIESGATSDVERQNAILLRDHIYRTVDKMAPLAV